MKNSKNSSTKVESKKASEKVLKANENLISNSLKQKHLIEDRSKKSAKDLKAIRSKNRRMLVNFSNVHFTNKDKSIQISNAKSFISYIVNHYQFTSFSFSANELYSAKDSSTIQSIQNLIDFCKSQKIAFKVHENLKA